MLVPGFAFDKAGLLAIIGWLLLLASLFVPAMRPPTIIVGRFIVPGIIGVAYIMLIATGFGEAQGGGFGSIPEVRALFASDAGLAAGWLHYLAFDLFVGTWIAQDVAPRPLWMRIAAIPCLVFTFLFGPAGWLLYALIRLAAPAARETQP